MKVQQINQQQNLNNQPRFTGVADAGVQLLRFLDTNQAWGATAVDLCTIIKIFVHKSSVGRNSRRFFVYGCPENDN